MAASIFFLIILVLGLFGLLVLVLNRLNRLLNTQTSDLAGWLKQTGENVNQSQRMMADRLDRTAAVIGGLKRELGSISEVGRGMKDLIDLIRSPKIRGQMGEESLSTILSNFLPKELYKLQYRFRTGETVDAAIVLKQGVIPIDSKFPKESFDRYQQAQSGVETERAIKDFQSDVKKHIAEIAKKYARAEAGVEEVLMFIPFEPIFNLVVTDREIGNYAREKKVGLTSPNLLVTFLRYIIRFTRAERLGTNLKAVLLELKSLEQEASRFSKSLSVLDRHLQNAKNSMEEVNSGYQKLGNRISTVGRLESSTTEQLAEESPSS